MIRRGVIAWRRWAGIAVGIASLAVAGVLVSSAGSISAAVTPCSNPATPYIDFGRDEFCGYFTNGYGNPGNNLWTTGVPAWVGTGATSLDKVNSFIRFVEQERGLSGNAEETSAEYVIDTMEGFTPPNNARGLAWNPAVVTNWENRLRIGVQTGILKIDWNVNWQWRCGQEDTLYSPSNNDVDAYWTFPRGETPSCIPASQWGGINKQYVPAINFIDGRTGKIIYQIKRTCGNPFGTLGALPNVDMNMVTTLGGAKTTGGAAVPNLTEGGTYNIFPTAANAGYVDSDLVYLELKDPNTNIITPTAADPPTGPGPGTSGHTTNTTCNPGYSDAPATVASSPPTACHATRWYWEYNNVPASSPVYTQQATFTVTTNQSYVGQTVCFQSDIVHANLAGEGNSNDYNTSSTQCYKIIQPDYPNVVGLNGDVHAGGGLCGSTLSNGFVKGNGNEDPNGSSKTQYVVSASDKPGGITNFGSNNAISGTTKDTLGLGSQGGYEQICEKSLVAAATKYLTQPGATYNPPKYPTPGNGGSAAHPYNISTWAGVYYLYGNSWIEGTVNSKMTIVQMSGTMTIQGNIPITDNSYYPLQVPSLGIISAGNILIEAGVTNIYAYLFADGTIDTCLEGENPPYPGFPADPNYLSACHTNLTVDGFLMGNTLVFHRIGPNGTKGPQTAETIVLTPQIYLNPPQLFDSTVDDVTLQGQGEQPPLF